MVVRLISVRLVSVSEFGFGIVFVCGMVIVFRVLVLKFVVLLVML